MCERVKKIDVPRFYRSKRKRKGKSMSSIKRIRRNIQRKRLSQRK